MSQPSQEQIDKAIRDQRLAMGHSRSARAWHEEWAGVVATGEGVWSLLSFFELPVNARQAISEELSSTGYPMEDFPLTYAAAGLKKRSVPVLLDPNDLVALTSSSERVSVCIRHARSYMTAAANSPPAVKPTFLYYGCLALSRAVVASFLAKKNEESHGISFNRETRLITVKPHGEIADLHDATFTLPNFYCDRSYPLDSVIRVLPGANAAMERVTRTKAFFFDFARCYRLKDASGGEATAHLITWAMLGTFALSNFSRYAPNDWEKILRGDPDGQGHAYSVFMDEVEVAVPLEVARLLSGIRYEYGLSPDEREQIEKQITERAGRWGRL